MKHFFVINPRSFPDKSKLERLIAKIKESFSGQHIERDMEIYVSAFPRDAFIEVSRFLRKLPAPSHDDGAARARVYAVGGDGILFDCLGGVTDVPGVELAALPFGSSNDFIRSLEQKAGAAETAAGNTTGSHKSRDIEYWRDIEAQMRGAPVTVDVMDCGTNYALNYCCVGIEAEALLKINEFSKKAESFCRRFRSGLFLLFGFLALVDKDIRLKWYRIEIDGESYDGRYYGINIANGRYYGGNFQANVDAAPDDGELDVLMIKPAGLSVLLPLVWDYVRGRWYKHSERFVYVRAKSIRIYSEDTLTIAVDAETYRDTELRVSVMPRAVAFNVPVK
jgi:diacylglycerol kinase family enzyme